MLGPSRAGRQRRRSFSRNLGQLAAASGAGFVCAVAVSNCSFPPYGFRDPVGGSGSAGEAGAGGESSSGGTSGIGGGAAGSSAGVAGSEQAGAAGEAGAAGAPGAPCSYPAPVTYPDHCFNGAVGAGETAVDCGGECAPCSGSLACSKDSDCVGGVCAASKTCSPLATLAYKSIVSAETTQTPKFSLSITYLDKLTPLQSIRIRYYFNHNAVAEPVLAHTQATLNPGNSQRDLLSTELAYRIFRYPPGPADPNGMVTDSVLEITFPSVASLTPNAVLNLTQDLVGASSEPSLSFIQPTHYSFFNGSNANPKITVYRDDQLLWGTPPALSELPSCAFVSGVNLNGPTVTVDGQPLQASADATVVYAGATYQSTSTLVPLADTSTTTLVRSGFTLGSASASWSVPNGKYWAYAWLTSDLSTNSGQLMIQDNPEDRFFGLLGTGIIAWGKVGPYPIDVLGGSVKLSATGAIGIAGVELYDVAP